MKSSLTKAIGRGMIIRKERFSRIKFGTGYITIKKQLINT
ncbi:hypothetical protein C8N25_102233 [Algoriphagus antarcticus]|uniref:Uncharacterized protein n=1 Tax=Algoriphagus antarcticus TaxID=238540 RepID=A0A3E0E5D9_9BACT|nr:hypothetical protein C8N25_102233 [Algoriphagus antarcticus]